MRTKDIQAAHEARMWIGQVIVPAIVGAVTLASNPQARAWLQEKKNGFHSKWNAVLKK